MTIATWGVGELRFLSFSGISRWRVCCSLHISQWQPVKSIFQLVVKAYSSIHSGELLRWTRPNQPGACSFPLATRGDGASCEWIVTLQWNSETTSHRNHEFGAEGGCQLTRSSHSFCCSSGDLTMCSQLKTPLLLHTTSWTSYSRIRHWEKRPIIAPFDNPDRPLHLLFFSYQMPLVDLAT